MGFAEQNLMKNETIIHRAELHWMIYVKGFLFSVVSFLFFDRLSFISTLFATLLLTYGVVQLILAGVAWISTECVITNKRVIMKVGLIRRISQENLLSKIEAINVDQSIFGRILDYGTICVVGTGGTQTPFPMIKNPINFRLRVQEQIDGKTGDVR